MRLDHYQKAPQSLRNKIELLLSRLEATVTQESKAAFAKIIRTNPNLHIYSLGIFYNSSSWDYVLPTFASEEGLQYVAESYSFDCVDKVKEKKIALRWSVCDSPHHDDDALLYMMPITTLLLQQLSSTLDEADPMYNRYQWPNIYIGNYGLFYEFLSHIYELIQRAVRLGLREVWKTPVFRDFFIANQCALTLNTDGLANDDLLNHIKRLNTEATYNKLKKELEQNTSKLKT